MLTLLFLIVCQKSESNLKKSHCPTRQEWLELSLFKLIKTETDAWERRIGFRIKVDEENGITVTLTSSNGQPIINETAKQLYIDMVRQSIKHFIKKYDWSKDLTVFVQYI
ncbi:MAG: hypothetical protein GF383_16260 [Candidatus Lokiarchaeota archaeon]|nr:hypothetical protein [Candidatus Lokiarchaeota archaeon]